MKVLQGVLILAAILAAAYASSATWGGRVQNDVLLMSQTVFRTPIAFNFQTVNTAFPLSGQTNNRNISAVFVFDQFTNSSGAIPTLFSGGPGFTFATVSLRSQYGMGINSSIQIYGR